MTDSNTWQEALEAITEGFQGRGPFNADEEGKVMRAWRDSPASVMDLATKAAHSYAAGTISRPWAWLAAAADGAKTKRPRPDTVANPVLELDAAERRARAWMRTAGPHFDRWEEVEDELFGDRGPLHAWRSDSALLDEWREQWEQARPAGVRAELAAAMRSEMWAANPLNANRVKDTARHAARVQQWALGEIPGSGHPDPTAPHLPPDEVKALLVEVVGERALAKQAAAEQAAVVHAATDGFLDAFRDI